MKFYLKIIFQKNNKIKKYRKLKLIFKIIYLFMYILALQSHKICLISFDV